MNYGFVKVAAAVPLVQVADCFYNIEKIEGLMRQASEKGVQIIAFPELSVTGYTCLDLFAQQTLLDGAEAALLQLVSNTADLDIPVTYTHLRANETSPQRCCGIRVV